MYCHCPILRKTFPKVLLSTWYCPKNVTEICRGAFLCLMAVALFCPSLNGTHGTSLQNENRDLSVQHVGIHQCASQYLAQ